MKDDNYSVLNRGGVNIINLTSLYKSEERIDYSKVGHKMDMVIYRYHKNSRNHKYIREIPKLIKILLKDRTTNRSIRWATDSYIERGSGYYPEKAIGLKQVVNVETSVIRPRMTKVLAEQKERTKANAEVFTPLWVVKKQNDIIEEEFKDLNLDEYVSKTWLEITCGEAPYMCSRYDAVSGEHLEIKDRIGFVDRKLKRISKEIDDQNEWFEYVVKAYQASYGYEYQGDSLLLARENLLYTFIDYYIDKFNIMPTIDDMMIIAKIISYNVFQMDGLTYHTPARYGYDGWYNRELRVINGMSVQIKNWDLNKMIDFRSLLEEGDGNDEI